MKEFVFLYPIQEYLNVFTKRDGKELPFSNALFRRFNQIIEARYRQQGFRVNWVFFSENGYADRPDLTSKVSEINIFPEDQVLASGISFLDLVKNRVYPDPAFILNQLSSDVEGLVVGGLHQWDCVNRIAEASYRRGINTFVDEDTTEIFFEGGILRLSTPLIRDRSALADIPPYLLEYVRESRADKPWFTQV